MNTETAISDLVAVMALIAVFVTAVAILGVTLLSHPPGDAAPAMIARSTVEDGNLSLSHDGGDPLVRGHFTILVDGVDRTDEFKLTDTSGIKHDTWTSWETGEALVLSGVPEGAHIQIVGEGVARTGSEWLLHGLGTVEPTVVPTTTEPTAEPTVVPTTTVPTTVPTTEPTPTPVPLVANFAANITSGFAPLTVQFTDTSTGGPTSWLWTFGDGTTSTVQNPIHTYTAPGTYTVSLTVNNAFNTTSVTKLNYIVVTKKSLFDETIFIYGKTLKFSGNTINAPGATAIITEGLNTNDLNGGASVAVSNLYFDDGVNLNGGSAGLGSKERPGVIYVNGDLTLVNGQRHVYGDVYVNGDFDLKDARIHGNVYVNGDLTLDWTPQLDDGSRIYYTGRLTKPDSYNADLLAKCIHNASVPKLDMPDIEFPSAKPASWYTERGYATDGTLISNIKIFVDSYSSTSWRPTATDVIIIARTGDITITGIGGSGVTGVFFAPNGKVTFEGKFLEGLVIARDGFFVTSGGTTVTFKPISHYIASSGDYPFEQG